MINEYWKEHERKRLCPKFRYYPGIRLERLRKSMKNLIQDSWSPHRDLNPGPPEYEAQVLITFYLFIYVFIYSLSERLREAFPRFAACICGQLNKGVVLGPSCVQW
jgi:hypothetical protein